jgi:MoxR-like ATPase
MSLQEKFTLMEKSIGSTYLERDSEVHNSSLALVSRSTHLLVGPPGTAKSAVVRAMCDHIYGGEYYQNLMFADLPPEAVLGPFNPKLFQEGEFKRSTKGYVPSAHVVFIDEVFKASSNVLTSLYNIMNEREFRNGSELVKVPCVSMFFACNKIDENQDRALLDRFYLKSVVRRVQRPDHIAEIIRSWRDISLGKGRVKADKSTNFVERFIPKDEHKISLDEVDEATCKSMELKVSDSAVKAATAIYTNLNQYGHDVSERRIKGAMRIAAAEAYLSSSNSVGPGHLIVLMDIIPNFPHEISKVGQIILMNIDERLARIYEIWNKCTKDYNGLRAEANKNDDWRKRCNDFSRDLSVASGKVEDLADSIPKDEEGQATIKKRAETMKERIDYMRAHIYALSNADLDQEIDLIGD